MAAGSFAMMNDDQWQAHVTREAALALGKWLQEANLLDRKIGSIRIEELQGMAAAAVSRWVVLQSQRLEQSKSGEKDAIRELLLF